MSTNTVSPFRALHSPSFRFYFIGQAISLMGTWIQQVTLGWLVYKLTGSLFLLGLVGFADKLPIFLFSSFAGVFVDRIRLHKLILTTQTLSLIQSAVLALLIFTGKLNIWGMIMLSLVLGSINAIDVPARQSFLITLIDKKENLSNAIALNSSMFNGARIIGPAIGGLLLGWVGPGACIALNTISFVGVLMAMLLMPLKPPPRPSTPVSNPLHEFLDGLRYAYTSLPIRYILILISMFNIFSVPFLVLMPGFVYIHLHGNASVLGMVLAASGVGAFLGAFTLVFRKTVLGLSRIILIAAVGQAVSLFFLTSFYSLWWVLPMLILNGYCALLHMASTNTMLQTIVDDTKRGRIMSLYTTATIGIAPFGNLLIGAAATTWGMVVTFKIGAIICLISCLWFYFNRPRIGRELKPIYQKKGILAIPLAEK
jgi:MFS family permease